MLCSIQESNREFCKTPIYKILINKYEKIRFVQLMIKIRNLHIKRLSLFSVILFIILAINGCIDNNP